MFSQWLSPFLHISKIRQFLFFEKNQTTSIPSLPSWLDLCCDFMLSGTSKNSSFCSPIVQLLVCRKMITFHRSWLPHSGYLSLSELITAKIFLGFVETQKDFGFMSLPALWHPQRPVIFSSSKLRHKGDRAFAVRADRLSNNLSKMIRATNTVLYFKCLFQLKMLELLFWD